MSSALGSIAGTVVGGLLGGGKSSGTTQTANREPWGPSQEWLKSLLQQGEQLQGYYQQNPFNSIQQQGYANTVNDADTYRNQLLPSVLSIANNYTNGSNFYDRRDPFKKPVAGQLNAPSSPEMQQKASDTSFLEGLYQYNFNTVDPEGLKFWQDKLRSGYGRDAVRRDFEQVRAQNTNTPVNPSPGGLLGSASAPTAQQFSLLNPYTSGKLQAAQAPAQMMQPQQFPPNFDYVNYFGGGGG